MSYFVKGPGGEPNLLSLSTVEDQLFCDKLAHRIQRVQIATLHFNNYCAVVTESGGKPNMECFDRLIVIAFVFNQRRQAEIGRFYSFFYYYMLE